MSFKTKEAINVKSKLKKKAVFERPTQPKENEGHINACNPTINLKKQPSAMMEEEGAPRFDQNLDYKSFLSNALNATKFGQGEKLEMEDEMDIESDRFVNREEQYHLHYGEDYKFAILRAQPNLQNVMARTCASSELRAKMLDWMLEVIFFFRPNSSMYTYFKAILLFDLYLKENCKYDTKPIENKDIHLIGITCVFIASKYEDHYHISCSKLLENAARGKFTVAQVERMEWEILKDIHFKTTIPSVIEIVDCILKNHFTDRTDQMYQRIRYFTLYFMIKLLHFEETCNHQLYFLCLAALLSSIKGNYETEIVAKMESRSDNSAQEIKELRASLQSLVFEHLIFRPTRLEHQNRCLLICLHIWIESYSMLSHARKHSPPTSGVLAQTLSATLRSNSILRIWSVSISKWEHT